jgi:ABC-type Fe3+ transport system permease subunit
MMATLTSQRSGWLSTFGAGRGFSKETASPLWAITAWIVGLIAFFPVLYMFLTGFKTENAAVDLPPKLIFWPTLENYEAVFGINFLPFFRNSIMTSLISTFFVMPWHSTARRSGKTSCSFSSPPDSCPWPVSSCLSMSSSAPLVIPSSAAEDSTCSERFLD